MVRLVLWGAVLVGLAAVSNDTRGARWLLVPGLVAAVLLIPYVRGSVRQLLCCHEYEAGYRLWWCRKCGKEILD